MLHKDNVRHGDLKPENILWFQEGKESGTLNIADLGLTRFHEKELDTKSRDWRHQGANTPSGTKRYEPPEMDEYRGTDKARPR
jgi:serine/threonine protein kinase